MKTYTFPDGWYIYRAQAVTNTTTNANPTSPPQNLNRNPQANNKPIPSNAATHPHRANINQTQAITVAVAAAVILWKFWFTSESEVR